MMHPVDTFVFQSLSIYYQVDDYRVLDEIIDFQGSVFEIEDFARIIHNKDFTKSDLELKVKEMKLSANILEAVLNKISLANKKIKVSISARDKVLALFFPFGLIINLLPNYNYFDQITHKPWNTRKT